MLKKLRVKFVCIMMAIVTVMLCVIFALVIHYTDRMLEQESVEALQKAVSDPGFLLENFDGESMPYFVLSRSGWDGIAVSSPVYLEKFGEDGVREIWNAVTRAGSQSGELEGYSLRFLRVSRPIGEAFVFLDISSQQMAMESLIRASISVGVFGLVIFLGLSILLAWWTVKPVEKAWEQQRQFVADASHELKTPLAVIMTNAELLQEPVCESDTQTQCSESILTMSRQMRGLVEGLLELARVDNGAVKSGFAELDLSALAEESVLPFEPLYFEKGLTLSTAIEGGIRVKGSEAHLRQVLDILLDNAMKYSAPAGQVWVALRRQGSHCVLMVASPGAPISREDLRNIFKRFYRIDKARSRDGSYGLGLSIARSIVTEHRGKIWAESENGVNTFFVQLPVIG